MCANTRNSHHTITSPSVQYEVSFNNKPVKKPCISKDSSVEF